MIKFICKVAPLLALLTFNAQPTYAQNVMKEGIRSGVALENYAKKRKAFFRKKSAVINRPAKQVKASLDQLARQCIQGVESSTRMRMGTGIGASVKTIRRAYDAKLTKENGTDRFLVLMGDLGGIKLSAGSKGLNVAVATQIIPKGNKTELKTTHMMAFQLFHKAAVDWASGKQTGCPKFR